jgi:uncharacterized protein YbaR (Trm112 family)
MKRQPRATRDRYVESFRSKFFNPDKTMVDPQLLEILCCPETRQDVTLAPASLVEELNGRIEAGTLQNRAGAAVREKMDGGLLRADGKALYPIREDIPVMLIDEAIPL